MRPALPGLVFLLATASGSFVGRRATWLPTLREVYARPTLGVATTSDPILDTNVPAVKIPSQTSNFCLANFTHPLVPIGAGSGAKWFRDLQFAVERQNGTPKADYEAAVAPSYPSNTTNWPLNYTADLRTIGV